MKQKRQSSSASTRATQKRTRSLDTTAYLLTSPKNRRRLLGALRDAQAGCGGKRMSVTQLRSEVGLGDE